MGTGAEIHQKLRGTTSSQVRLSTRRMEESETARNRRLGLFRPVPHLEGRGHGVWHPDQPLFR
jgi:hypothetical protein